MNMNDEPGSESPEERLERLIEEEKVINSVLKQTKLKYEELRLEQKELQHLHDELMKRCQDESVDKKEDNKDNKVLNLKLECANQVIHDDRPVPAREDVLEFDEIVKSIQTDLSDDNLDEMMDEFTSEPT